MGYGPLFLARDLGYYKNAGVDIDIQQASGGGEELMGLMLAKRLSGVSSTIDHIVKYGGPDVCFKAVLTLDDSHGGDGLLTPVDTTDIHQLKGKSIALQEGSTDDFWLKYLLRQAGMAASDVEIVNMSPDDAATAFIAGRVPYAMTWEPHLTFVRETHRGKVLLDSSTSPGVIVDVVIIRCDVLASQRDDVKKLVDAVLKADDYIKTNPDQAYAIMKKYVGGFLPTPESFLTAINGVRYYDRAKNVEYLGTMEHPGPAADIIKFADDLWSDSPQLASIVKGNTYAAIVDPTLIGN